MFGIKPTQVQAIGQGPIALEQIIVSIELGISWGFERGLSPTEILVSKINNNTLELELITRAKIIPWEQETATIDWLATTNLNIELPVEEIDLELISTLKQFTTKENYLVVVNENNYVKSGLRSSANNSVEVI